MKWPPCLSNVIDQIINGRYMSMVTCINKNKFPEHIQMMRLEINPWLVCVCVLLIFANALLIWIYNPHIYIIWMEQDSLIVTLCYSEWNSFVSLLFVFPTNPQNSNTASITEANGKEVALNMMLLISQLNYTLARVRMIQVLFFLLWAQCMERAGMAICA